MKKITIDKWEEQYVAGPVERFDQKYTMGRRHQWDLELKERMKDMLAVPIVSDDPGWTLMDWAMRVASRSIVPKLEMMNLSKPNGGNADAATNPFATMDRSLRPPNGATLDVSDPALITQYIKKVAISFGADMVGICRLDRRWVYSYTYDTQKTEQGHKSQEIPLEYR